MILILIAICAAALISAGLLRYAGNDYGGLGLFAGIAGVLLAIGTGFAAVSYAFAGWSWMAAESKAQIINREYGTKYTREEIFYASDVIDTIREIDRKRVEVNGDLLRDGEK